MRALLLPMLSVICSRVRLRYPLPGRNVVFPCRGFVYGEITAQGMRRLARRVTLNQSDCFYDLGSGIGRAVLQAFLEFGVHRSVGIELASTRHHQAVSTTGAPKL